MSGKENHNRRPDRSEAIKAKRKVQEELFNFQQEEELPPEVHQCNKMPSKEEFLEELSKRCKGRSEFPEFDDGYKITDRDGNLFFDRQDEKALKKNVNEVAREMELDERQERRRELKELYEAQKKKWQEERKVDESSLSSSESSQSDSYPSSQSEETSDDEEVSLSEEESSSEVQQKKKGKSSEKEGVVRKKARNVPNLEDLNSIVLMKKNAACLYETNDNLDGLADFLVRVRFKDRELVGQVLGPVPYDPPYEYSGTTYNCALKVRPLTGKVGEDLVVRVPKLTDEFITADHYTEIIEKDNFTKESIEEISERLRSLKGKIESEDARLRRTLKEAEKGTIQLQYLQNVIQTVEKDLERLKREMEANEDDNLKDLYNTKKEIFDRLSACWEKLLRPERKSVPAIADRPAKEVQPRLRKIRAPVTKGDEGKKLTEEGISRVISELITDPKFGADSEEGEEDADD